jgi:hypothetical protein
MERLQGKIEGQIYKTGQQQAVPVDTHALLLPEWTDPSTQNSGRWYRKRVQPHVEDLPARPCRRSTAELTVVRGLVTVEFHIEQQCGLAKGIYNSHFLRACVQVLLSLHLFVGLESCARAPGLHLLRWLL